MLCYNSVCNVRISFYVIDCEIVRAVWQNLNTGCVIVHLGHISYWKWNR